MSSSDRVRVRGVTIHRPLIYGNTACLLTTEEKKNAPPDHTHRWTVAVRSAASAQGSDIVGGADDISYFIKRVTFKLHDTYPNPTRTIEKHPFEVTETGWGEFEVQIRITFVPEAGEKNLTLYHHIKLHPWTTTAAGEQAENASTNALDEPVHSWQYDEIVFSDPYQNFLNLLTQHPPTPLPKAKTKPVPFHLSNPGSLEASKGGLPEFTIVMEKEECDRLEEAKKSILAEQTRWKEILLEKEKELEQLQKQAG
ncbi:yeats family protein [Amanita rubescens]|nr:yeats family protein [Amanita rubescens]